MATQNILKIQADVKAAGIPVRGEPIVVVRKIKGTATPSQHSYGNAIDWYPTDPREAADAAKGIRVESLERLYSFLRSHSLANTVCYYRRGGCTTDHLDHCHVDAHPKVTSQANLQTVLAGGVGKGSGVDYVGMSPSQLGAVDCGQIVRDRDLIAGIAGQLSASQKAALKGRADQCGADNPLLPNIIEGPVESAGDALASVGDFIGTIANPEFVVRVAFVVGGTIVGVAGLYFIGKEFGLPSATSVAKTAVTKGLA